MAGLADLFGGGGGKPPAPKWNEPGDAHVGVCNAEPYLEQEKDFHTKLPKYMVKDPTGKWRPKQEGDFVKDAAEYFPIMNIVVPVTLEGGAEATFYFGGARKDALKEAMKESGVDLGVGTTVGVRLLKIDGLKRTWSVKLAKNS